MWPHTIIYVGGPTSEVVATLGGNEEDISVQPNGRTVFTYFVDDVTPYCDFKYCGGAGNAWMDAEGNLLAVGGGIAIKVTGIPASRAGPRQFLTEMFVNVLVFKEDDKVFEEHQRLTAEGDVQTKEIRLTAKHIKEKMDGRKCRRMTPEVKEEHNKVGDLKVCIWKVGMPLSAIRDAAALVTSGRFEEEETKNYLDAFAAQVGAIDKSLQELTAEAVEMGGAGGEDLLLKIDSYSHVLVEAKEAVKTAQEEVPFFELHSILDRKGTQYLVRWAGSDADGQDWPDEWVGKSQIVATDLLTDFTKDEERLRIATAQCRKRTRAGDGALAVGKMVRCKKCVKVFYSLSGTSTHCTGCRARARD
jgi:hypothetical protein